MLDDGEIPPVRERLGGLIIDGSQDALVDWFTSNRDVLTDIPLTIPLLDKLTIAGTATIEAPDGVQVTGRDFAAFEVVADWRPVADLGGEMVQAAELDDAHVADKPEWASDDHPAARTLQALRLGGEPICPACR